MREWLRGGVSPCQGEGRGFESRLALAKPYFAGNRKIRFFSASKISYKQLKKMKQKCQSFFFKIH